MQQAHLGNNPQFPVICTRVRAITFKVVEYERKEEHRYVLIIFSWQCIFLGIGQQARSLTQIVWWLQMQSMRRINNASFFCGV